MAVPAWIWFLEPVIKNLATSEKPLARSELVKNVIRDMQLSPDELAEMAGSTKYTKAQHRSAWALSYASMAGLAESPRRGTWQLTDAGRSLLAKYPQGIPETELQKISRVRKRAAEGAAEEAFAPVPESAASESTPDERLRAAYTEIRQSVRAELLDNVRSVAPEKFESIVLDVLHAMGYGRSRKDLQQTAAGADGGIDGVISLDRLGLEKVYVQAKRYAEDNPVSRPAIQGFLGALAGRRASKGVFITTSRFSKEARDFAASASDSLVLLDGAELADLMVEYGVGVSEREKFTLVSIDGDYFEEG